MASDEERGEKQPLLSLNAPPERIDTVKKRKTFRRCKSVPIENFATLKPDPTQPIRPDEALFGRFHPSLCKVSALLALYLGAGTICFYAARDQLAGKSTGGALDAVYFCVVTMTTVGYGDLVPSTTVAKLLACAFVFVGMTVVGFALSGAADYLVEKQEIFLVRALHMGQRVGQAEILREAEINRARYEQGRENLPLFFFFLVFLFYFWELDMDISPFAMIFAKRKKK